MDKALAHSKASSGWNYHNQRHLILLKMRSLRIYYLTAWSQCCTTNVGTHAFLSISSTIHKKLVKTSVIVNTNS